MSKILIGLEIALIIIVILVLMIGGWVMGLYNGMVTQNQTVSNSWAKVETQYQRRFDLIPNLVGATQGMLTQEQKVFGAIADARTHYAGAASGSDDKVAATNEMEGALSRLLVIMEAYPTLTSNQTVKALMDELAGTENRVQVARQDYNDQVQIWNTQIKVFPTNIIAAMFGFKERIFFQSTTGAETAPTVKLNQ
jgi:LemA protein